MLKAMLGKWRSLKFPASGLRLHLLGVVLALLAFLFSSLVLFPVEALRERLEQEVAGRTEARLEIAELTLKLPAAVAARRVRVELPRHQDVVMVIDRLRLTPVWGSLFGGPLSLRLEAVLLEGTLDGVVDRTGAVVADLAGLQVANALPDGFPYPVVGTLDGRLTSDGPPLADGTTAEIDLSLEGGQVTGLQPLGIADGQLAIGRVQVKGKAVGRRVQVEEITARGGDVEITGKGTLFVGDTPERSRLALQLKVRPMASLEPGVRDLFSLTGAQPGRDGYYSFRLSGTLAVPRLN